MVSGLRQALFTAVAWELLSEQEAGRVLGSLEDGRLDATRVEALERELEVALNRIAFYAEQGIKPAGTRRSELEAMLAGFQGDGPTFDLDRLQRSSPDELHRAIWGDLAAKPHQLLAAQAVLSRKMGERLHYQPSNEDHVARFMSSMRSWSLEQLERTLSALERISQRIPSDESTARVEAARALIEIKTNELAGRPAPGSVEHHVREFATISLEALQGLKRISSNLTDAQRQAIDILIARRIQDGPAPTSFAFHPERIGALPDPRLTDAFSQILPSGHRIGTYESFAEHPLFVGPPTPEQVVQAPSLGDCFLISSLASIAFARPEAIEPLLHRADGTLGMTFWSQSLSGEFTSKTQTADWDLPVSAASAARPLADRLLGCRCPTRDAEGRTAIWGPMIEKLFAVDQGGYRSIDAGGFTDWVMHRLFGPHVKNRPLTGADDVAQEIERAIAMRWPVTASVNSDSRHAWLRHPHAYSVLGLVERDGERFVRVRDPHAEHYTREVPKQIILEEDGKFLVPARAFSTVFPTSFVHELD